MGFDRPIAQHVKSLQHNRPLMIAIAFRCWRMHPCWRSASPRRMRSGCSRPIRGWKSSWSTPSTSAPGQGRGAGPGQPRRRRQCRCRARQSPLPDLRKIENGDSIKALQRRIAELEQQQKNPDPTQKSGFTAAPVAEQDKPDPTRATAPTCSTPAAPSRA
jgi:hypothetical protein